MKSPDYTSVEQSQKVRFLNFSLLATAGACIILGIQNIPEENNLYIFLFFIGGLSFLCVFVNKWRYYIAVTHFITILLLGAITYSLVVGIGLKDAGMIAYPIYIIIASYLFSKKAVPFITLMTIGSVAVVYYFDQFGNLTSDSYSGEIQFKVILIFLFTAGFLLWAVMDNWEKGMKNLRDAYDLTLAGWGQALELRDNVTEGHSQRVVGLTLALADRLGVSKHKLEHIRRGALLHDIGKMAVPDSILLKKDVLSDSEWEVVKMHPVHARNLIENIPFLKPALEIPYSHHERWDGKGYPEGLAKENIPFAARIFAVVDVWDALTSDRPYRQAWPKDKVCEYIHDQSGKQFDPEVVKMFLELVEESAACENE